jgi:hypothetical protein
LQPAFCGVLPPIAVLAAHETFVAPRDLKYYQLFVNCYGR